jgi:DNA-binding CsgD family transcriptional regulator/AmiR/NasT family two-component response regulator
MNAATHGVFALAATTRYAALIADTASASAEQSQKALAACEASSTLLTDVAYVERTVRERRPDVVIVDQDFGGRRHGLAVADIVLGCSDASVILIGDDFASFTGGILSERCHVLQRPLHSGQLRTTIHVALERRARRAVTASAPAAEARFDEAAVSHDLRLVDRDAVVSGPWAKPAVSFDRLRPREKQIVQLLLAHFRVPAVATTLGISPHTVRNHLKNIYRRFGLRSQQDVLRALSAR